VSRGIVHSAPDLSTPLGTHGNISLYAPESGGEVTPAMCSAWVAFNTSIVQLTVTHTPSNRSFRGTFPEQLSIIRSRPSARHGLIVVYRDMLGRQWFYMHRVDGR
jgi:hypothetical protein